MLAEALRHERRARRTRWRRLDAGQQAIVGAGVAASRRDLHGSRGWVRDRARDGVPLDLREALDLLAAMASPVAEAVEFARRKAFVIVDGTLLRTDRVGMTGGRDRLFYSGKQKRHGVNVQVVADPAGRLIWTPPVLPGARHDMGAAREHGLLTALEAAGVRVIAEGAYRGAGANVEVPQRRSPRDPETGERHRRLSTNEKAVNSAHARLRGPGERANAQIKSCKVLRKLRSSRRRATRLVDAVRSSIDAD